jgi:hypothetical protein
MIARIERALAVLAYFIELEGEVHIHMYEKFEAELEALKRKEATHVRAQQRLAAYRNHLSKLQVRVAIPNLFENFPNFRIRYDA